MKPLYEIIQNIITSNTELSQSVRQLLNIKMSFIYPMVDTLEEGRCFFYLLTVFVKLIFIIILG